MTPAFRFTIFAFYLLLGIAKSQINTDSLSLILKSKAHDTIKTTTSSALTQHYWNFDLKKALQQAKNTIGYAVHSGNDKFIATAFNDLAGTYYFMNDLQNALRYNLKTLQLRTKKKKDGSTVASKKAISQTYNNIASLYLSMAEFEKSIEYNLHALKIKEELNDSLAIARSLTNIANVYETMNNFEMAIKYQIQSFKLMNKLNNENGIAACHNNLGNIYLKTKSYSKSKYHLEQAIKFREKQNDTRGLATSYNNLGELYFQINQYKGAKYCFEKAMELNSNMNDEYVKTALLINLAETYRRTDNKQKAIQAFNEGIGIAQRMGYLELEMNAYDGLAKMYSATKDFEKAYLYMKKHVQINDSIFKTTTSKHIAELQAKFDDASKSKEIEKLKKKQILSELSNSKRELELQKQKNIKYLFLATCILLFVSGGFLYSRFRLKNKINEKLEIQNKMISEKNNDITNSILYAKRIQNAIMTQEKYMEKELRRLKKQI
jgi:tetratricopeptide (TPR) repeat protein